MKHLAFSLFFLFIGIILNAQNDPTPDSWKDSGINVITDKKVVVENYIQLTIEEQKERIKAVETENQGVEKNN